MSQTTTISASSLLASSQESAAPPSHRNALQGEVATLKFIAKPSHQIRRYSCHEGGKGKKAASIFGRVSCHTQKVCLSCASPPRGNLRRETALSKPGGLPVLCALFPNDDPSKKILVAYN